MAVEQVIDNTLAKIFVQIGSLWRQIGDLWPVLDSTDSLFVAILSWDGKHRITNSTKKKKSQWNDVWLNNEPRDSRRSKPKEYTFC